jgi:hypothetical protein
LGVYHGYAGTNQTHLEAILRTSTRNYSFSRKGFDSFEEEAKKADAIEFLDGTQVTKRIQDGRSDMKQFFERGQLFSRQYFLGVNTVKNRPIPVELHRAIARNEEGFFFRKVYHIPGYYLILQKNKNSFQYLGATGVNNLHLESPVLIEYEQLLPDNEGYSVATGVLSKDIRNRIFHRILHADIASGVSNHMDDKAFRDILHRQEFEQTRADTDKIENLHLHLQGVIKLTERIKEKMIKEDAHKDTDMFAKVYNLTLSEGISPYEDKFVHTDSQRDLVEKCEEELWK